MDILRSIINLNKEPRILQYVETPKKELQKLGIQIDSRKYHPISLPKGVNTKTIEIPGMKEGCVWLAKFWSNLIPHVGLTDENGHFVIGLGQYVDRRTECYSL